MGWLHATPDKRDKTRQEQHGKDSILNSLPEVDYLVALSFQDMGMCVSGGMGQSPLTWQDVGAYSSQSGVKLNQWESRQVISMSRQYCSWAHKGKDPACVSPWNDNSEEAINANRKRVAESMLAMKAERKNKTK